MDKEQGMKLADIQSVPPSRVHVEESGEIWIENDLNDRRIIRVQDNFAAPLAKSYRLKDSITREEAAKRCTDLLRQIENKKEIDEELNEKLTSIITIFTTQFKLMD